MTPVFTISQFRRSVATNVWFRLFNLPLAGLYNTVCDETASRNLDSSRSARSRVGIRCPDACERSAALRFNCFYAYQSSIVSSNSPI